MDEAQFADFITNRVGTYHLVDNGGRYIIRKETGNRVFCTFVDYNDKIVLFDGDIPSKDKVLMETFPRSHWVKRGTEPQPCSCGIEECEGKLTSELYIQEVGIGWTLALGGE